MRLFSSGLILVAMVLLDSTTAGASSQVGADKSLTGRAIPCKDSRIENFKCHNVELLAYLPKAVLGEATGYDVWGWGDSTTSREFVLIGGASGTAFVEVTDPINPKYLGLLPPHGGVTNGGAQSVKV